MFEALTSYTTRQANAISAWLKTIGASMPTLGLSTRMAMPVGLSDRLQKMRSNVPSFQGFSMQHNARLVVLLHMGLLAMTLTAGLTLGYVAGHIAAYVSIAAISVMARGSFKAFFTALQQYVAQLHKQPAIIALLLTSALCIFYAPLATAIGVESVLLACTCVDVILLVDNAFWKMVLLPSHVHFSGHWSDRLQVVLRAWVYLQQAYAGVESTAKPVGKPVDSTANFASPVESAVTPEAKPAGTPVDSTANFESPVKSAVTSEAVGTLDAKPAVTSDAKPAVMPVDLAENKDLKGNSADIVGAAGASDALTPEVELSPAPRVGERDQVDPTGRTQVESNEDLDLQKQHDSRGARDSRVKPKVKKPKAQNQVQETGTSAFNDTLKKTAPPRVKKAMQNPMTPTSIPFANTTDRTPLVDLDSTPDGESYGGNFTDVATAKKPVGHVDSSASRADSPTVSAASNLFGSGSDPLDQPLEEDKDIFHDSLEEFFSPSK